MAEKTYNVDVNLNNQKLINAAYIQRVKAGQDLSSGRIVYLESDKAYYADANDTSIVGRSTGITVQAALEDADIEVQLFGIMYWPDNNLVPGTKYFIGSNGMLVTGVEGLAVVQQVGDCISTDKLFIKFSSPILTT